MSANVFLVIIPNQTIVVADLKAGRTPDPKYGAIAKLRSTHNNYLTLPVLFLMLSNHYPLAFATEWNWLIASLVFLMGVTIRHYFNTMHATGRKPNWTWAATAIIFVIIMWLSSAPGSQREELAGLSPMQERFASAAGFAAVADTVRGRCSMCHTAEPGWPGVHRAPKGVILETDAADRGVRARDLPAGGAEPCHAAGQRLGDRAGGAQGDRRVVPRGRVGLSAPAGLSVGVDRAFGPAAALTYHSPRGSARASSGRRSRV